jgi:hypothetical protein
VALEEVKKETATQYAVFKAASEKRAGACMLFSMAQCKLALKEAAEEELKEAKAAFAELGDGVMDANVALALVDQYLQGEKPQEAVDAASAALDLSKSLKSLGVKKVEARALHALSVPSAWVPSARKPTSRASRQRRKPCRSSGTLVTRSWRPMSSSRLRSGAS